MKHAVPGSVNEIDQYIKEFIETVNNISSNISMLSKEVLELSKLVDSMSNNLYQIVKYEDFNKKEIFPELLSENEK